MPSLSLRLLERDLLPDAVIRFGIRRLLAERLRDERKGDVEAQRQRRHGCVSQRRGRAILPFIPVDSTGAVARIRLQSQA